MSNLNILQTIPFLYVLWSRKTRRAYELNCSWFHFTQAAKKRAMQTPQLVPYLLQNKNAREIYYKLLSLPLLPAKDIVPQFRKLKVLALANNRAIFVDFIKYYENQWIKRVGSTSYS